MTQYARRRDLALRAKAWEQVFDPMLPGIFLAWAKRTDIDVPAELVAAVEKRGVQITDWKALYDQAAVKLKRVDEMHASQIADWERLYNQAKDTLAASRSQPIEMAEEKNRRIASLEERVALNDAELTRSDAAVGRVGRRKAHRDQ